MTAQHWYEWILSNAKDYGDGRIPYGTFSERSRHLHDAAAKDGATVEVLRLLRREDLASKQCGPTAERADPRGPVRKVIHEDSEQLGRVTLDCGHVRDFNPVSRYRVGEERRCFACLKSDQPSSAPTAATSDNEAT